MIKKIYEISIPSEILVNLEQTSRAQLVLLFTIALAFWSPIFSLLYYLIGAKEISFAVLLAGCAAVFIPITLRGIKSINVAANITGIILFIVITVVAYFTGGQATFVLMWLIAIPSAIVATASRFYGILWIAIGIGELIFFYFYPKYGGIFPQTLPKEMFSLINTCIGIGALCVVSSLALISENQRMVAIKMAFTASEREKRRARELESANKQLLVKEDELKKSQEELIEKLNVVENFNKIMISRELVMIELKEEVNSLLSQLGEKPKYKKV
ncbi:MAG: hypothetical protein HQK49_15565 [Oligoflexia bacterium]|nr:hypothetical protein [Oligoflexia bacterium]